MTKAYRVGLDAGNSEATLAYAAGQGTKTVTLPSYIGAGTLAELQRMRRGGAGRQAGAPQDGEYVLEFRGEQFVGQLAIDQSPDASSARGDIRRYWSGHTLKLLLVLCGMAFATKQQRLLVTTGLPVQVWSEENAAHVRRALSGRHDYLLNGERRVVEVAGVLVMMEGAGALARLGSDQPIRQGVIDIGGRTTLLYMAQGQEPVLARCDGVAKGVESIGDVLSERFEATYGRPLEAWETRAILRAHVAGVPQPDIYVNRKRVRLDGELHEAVDQVAHDITTFISTTWRSGERGQVASEVAQLYLVGGGAHYFAPHIQRAVGDVTISARPELENALGYKAVGDVVPDDVWAALGE